MRNEAYVNTSFHNIENTAQRGGRRLLGYSRTGRVFMVSTPRHAAAAERWRARALTPRDDMVNEIRGPSLASISNQLEVTP